MFFETMARCSAWILNYAIPQLRQNPKFFMSYDAEIVWDLASEGFPLILDGFAKEFQDRIRELFLCRVISIVRHMLMHDRP